MKCQTLSGSTFFEIAEKLNVTDIDKDTLDKIFEALHNHTLACELILRLLKKSAFTADELLDKILNEHVGLEFPTRYARIFLQLITSIFISFSDFSIFRTNRKMLCGCFLLRLLRALTINILCSCRALKI